MEPNRPSIDGWDRIATRHVAPAVTAATLPPASIESSAAPRRRRRTVALYLYTGATIVVGLAALAWASLTLDIWPEISLTQAGGKEGILLGLLFWILIGLLGGTRVEQLHGFGVLTFHLPFIIAATALGGPVAGGWVAMISTLEARELREVPWYGTLANHSAMALSAVLGGIVYAAVREGPLGDITDQPQAAQLVAIVLATFVLSGLSACLATGTVILRDGLSLREAARLLDTSYRKTAASEVVLGWVLAVAYGSVGWWAALVCATLVLVVWQAHIDRERARHDAMTGLLSRTGFDARLAEVLVGVGRGAGRIALLAIDLDRFKAVNDEYGHGTGDQVIREVGARLQASVRLTDAAVRLGGDEFGVLLVGVSDAAAAEALAWKIHRSLCEPIETDRATITIGASIGVYVLEPGGRMPTIERLHAISDQEMFLMKADGGGVRVRASSDPISSDQAGPTGRVGTSRPQRAARDAESPAAAPRYRGAMSSRQVEVPGGRLAVRDEGAGPPIVLLHAGVADLRAWDDVVPPLIAAGYRAVRYDARGHGPSPTDDVAFSQRADLLAVLDALGIGRAALVGNSRGGMIALDTAIETPDRVVAVVAVAAGISGFDGEATPAEQELFERYRAVDTAEPFDAAALTAFEVGVWADGPARRRDRAPAAVRGAPYRDGPAAQRGGPGEGPRHRSGPAGQRPPRRAPVSGPRGRRPARLHGDGPGRRTARRRGARRPRARLGRRRPHDRHGAARPAGRRRHGASWRPSTAGPTSAPAHDPGRPPAPVATGSPPRLHGLSTIHPDDVAMEPMIRVQHLTKRYKKSSVAAVDDVSFDVEPGELFAFLGPNGAGKTTTISILTTMLPKTDGR